MALEPQPAHPPTEPRVRRLLSFGDILDEGVRLYRAHFATFALFSAVALLPSGAILVWASASGLLTGGLAAADFQATGRLVTDPAALAGLDAQLSRLVGAAFVVGLLGALFHLLWSAAMVASADALWRGEHPSLPNVYLRAASRVPVIILSTILFLLGMAGLTAVATALFLVTFFGILGTCIAVVGLLFWWLRPTARRRWLKWLIVLAAPYGLPIYFAFRWAMYLAASVLENRGPLDALRRSSQLTAGQWFRVGSVLIVAPLIVGILITVVSALVGIPLGIASAARGEFDLDPTSAAVSTAIDIVMQILFESVAIIVYTLLFHDLRNRREGADIVERVSLLETAPLLANG
jgi:hypothetical protein